MICYPLLGKNGEFGNQLFQIAATLSHAVDCNDNAIFPEWLYSKLFKHNISETLSSDKKIENKYTEQHFYFDPIPKLPNLALYGYFQSEKYFKKNFNFIKKYFKFKDDIYDYIFKKYNFISEENCVGVHLRTYSRGQIDPRHLYYDILEEPEYLKKAFNFFGRDRKFIVCSDNIKKCKSILGNNKSLIFIENESLYIDFCILTMCKDNINSSSSFSWWSSYLNENVTKQIITPKKWFKETDDTWFNSKDVIPEEWIKL